MVLHLVIAIGESDCERIGSGLLAQPVNAVSSMVFAVFGVIILFSVRAKSGVERTNRLLFGSLMVATGMGSVLFHGPQGAASHFLHDATFLVTVIALTTMNLAGRFGWTQQRSWATIGIATASVAMLLLLWPSSTNIVAGVAVAALVGVDILLHSSGLIRSRWWISSVIAMGLAIAFFVVGRTGGPLCNSSSLFQGHAMWHILSATALWAYFESTSRVRDGADS
jgi:hypothetical protein